MWEFAINLESFKPEKSKLETFLISYFLSTLIHFITVCFQSTRCLLILSFS